MVHSYVDEIDVKAADGSDIAYIADRDLDSVGMPPDNARLIAAAPKLLAACKAALSAYDRAYAGEPKASWSGKDVDAMRQAIIEAEGQP